MKLNEKFLEALTNGQMFKSNETFAKDLESIADKHFEQLAIQGVSISLPDDFWYSDENGNEVHLIGVIKDWCVVENRITEDTWVEPFEFVNSLYNDSLQGNKC